jgi:predicted ArsR family transcriptional regulator
MRIPHSYHNTTHETGKTLAEYEGKAKTQEERILEYFRNNWHTEMSPSQVQNCLGMHGTPITSIRRAITNLTTDGKLVKTDKKVKGIYGRAEFTWRLARRQVDWVDE